MNYIYEIGKWETKNHKIIDIKDMETSHICNTIKYLKKNPEFYQVGYYNALDFSDNYYEPNYELVEQKILELQDELNRRSKV